MKIEILNLNESAVLDSHAGIFYLNLTARTIEINCKSGNFLVEPLECVVGWTSKEIRVVPELLREAKNAGKRQMVLKKIYEVASRQHTANHCLNKAHHKTICYLNNEFWATGEWGVCWTDNVFLHIQ